MRRRERDGKKERRGGDGKRRKHVRGHTTSDLYLQG